MNHLNQLAFKEQFKKWMFHSLFDLHFIIQIKQLENKENSLLINIHPSF